MKQVGRIQVADDGQITVNGKFIGNAPSKLSVMQRMGLSLPPSLDFRRLYNDQLASLGELALTDEEWNLLKSI